MSWDAYSQQRSQLLQLIIRSASGDARLMNPIAFAESHPGCRRNAQVWGRLTYHIQVVDVACMKVPSFLLLLLLSGTCTGFGFGLM
jgi:hypothetical protein